MMIDAMNVEHTALSLWGLDHLPEREYYTALDVGCGGGVNVKRLASFCREAWGIDVSELSVKESKKRCRKEIKEGRTEIRLGSAENLPFSGNTFDLATAFETVYFWQDLEKCFGEVCRTLKENGVFLIVNELKKEKDRPDKYEELQKVLTLNIYDGEELTEALINAGFSDVTIYTEGENWICAVAQK